LPELKEVGGNGQPCLKGLPVMRDAGLTTSTTLFLGTRQDISVYLALRDTVLTRRPLFIDRFEDESSMFDKGLKLEATSS